LISIGSTGSEGDLISCHVRRLTDVDEARRKAGGKRSGDGEQQRRCSGDPGPPDDERK